MAIDPEYLSPDDLLKMLLSTFQQSTSGMLKNFLEMHRSVRKWFVVSDFVIADPQAFRDAYVYTLFPYETPLEQLKAHLAKLAPRDLKKSKTVSHEFTNYLQSGAVFSFCFLTPKRYRVAGNIENVREALDKTVQMMQSWHDAGTQTQVIQAFRVLRQRANANGFNAGLMSTMTIATSVAAFVALILAAESRAELVGWFPDRDKITHAYDRIASYMFSVNFSAFCQQQGVDEGHAKIIIGDAAASDIGGEDAWYDELIRVPDAVAGALAVWDYERNLVPSKLKFSEVLRGAIADNPYLVILSLMVTNEGRGVGVVRTSRSPFPDATT